MFNQKKIALGVSGSIAAYKAVEIARLILKQGGHVTAILSPEACRFVTPLTFEAITGSPVIVDLWGGGDWTGSTGRAAASMPHIDLSRDVDLFLVAPATANVIGKMANGIADDALTTALVTCPAPLVVAPAMNYRMWQNANVQRNVAHLKESGVLFVGPESGALAEGESGFGRLSDPEFIVDEVKRALMPPSRLTGRRVLVTSGRTEEPLDPVRFVSNRSSGKMGFALAAAARHLGAEVTLVTGPAAIPAPRGVNVVHVRSTDEMAQAVDDAVPGCDVLVMAAAVSDYRPMQERLHKIESGQSHLVMELSPTQDILQKIKNGKGRRIFVGFALETKNEIENGRRKLLDKGLDMICVNNPLKPGSEFGSDTNIVTLVHRNGRVEVLPRLPKYEVAMEILRRVGDMLEPGPRPPLERRPLRPVELPVPETDEAEMEPSDEPIDAPSEPAAGPAETLGADMPRVRSRVTRRGRRGGRRRRGGPAGGPSGTGNGGSEG